MSSVLIIDDDRSLCRSLEIQLSDQGYEVAVAVTATEGLAALEHRRPEIVLLDLNLPDMDGLEVLQRMRAEDEELPVVMITGRQDMKATIEAMRSGAFDYLRKPFDLEDILLVIEKVKRYAAPHPDKTVQPVGESPYDGPYEIIGSSRGILELVKQIGLLSRSQVTVMVTGESGTGKELVARALHEATSGQEPFIAINCSAVVPTLLESELFGHEKGAFTGAEARKIGKLEFVGRGTVFLDEIGDMPLELQSKFLRVLQEHEFNRVGGLESIPFEARVVAATHRDPAKMVGSGKFRQDLYYRLAVTQLVVPALRERIEDIPLIARHLIGGIGRMLHQRVEAIEEPALRLLKSYDWPGNVRELENVLTRAAVLAKGRVITVEEIKTALGGPVQGTLTEDEEIVTLKQAEKEHIVRALRSTGWNITRTAALLEVSPTTLRKKIHDYSLRKPY